MIFLFPGQGSQTPGMMRDFYEGSASARGMLARAAAVLGDELLSVMFDGPEDRLRETCAAQPALVIAGAAIAAHLKSAGVRPTACAGHSVGEIAALVAAGTLAFEDALRLTRERARLMSENVPEGGMAAVLGLAPEAIEAALPEGAEVANYNGPSQTIISGPRAALDMAAESLKAAGAKRVMPLNVSGPFHSSLMKAAGEGLREYLRGVTFSAPRTHFVSSVSGREERDPHVIRELLWKQVFSPVRWTEVMRALGPEEALELGPGTVLQGLAKRTEGAPVVRAAGTLDQVAAFVKIG